MGEERPLCHVFHLFEIYKCKCMIDIVGVMAHTVFQAQRWRQEDQEVKIILNYVVSSRLTSLKYKEKSVFCNQ